MVISQIRSIIQIATNLTLERQQFSIKRRRVQVTISLLTLHIEIQPVLTKQTTDTTMSTREKDHLKWYRELPLRS
jgi:hypothetical protein